MPQNDPRNRSNGVQAKAPILSVPSDKDWTLQYAAVDVLRCLMDLDRATVDMRSALIVLWDRLSDQTLDAEQRTCLRILTTAKTRVDYVSEKLSMLSERLSQAIDSDEFRAQMKARKRGSSLVQLLKLALADSDARFEEFRSVADLQEEWWE